jgi:DNA-binding MarR family transcriptional regulator
VVSEIVDGLARKGLLERERDPDDRRRTLVWLTGEGQEVLRRDGEVLSVDALTTALRGVPADVRAGLLAGATALLAAAPTALTALTTDREDSS